MFQAWLLFSIALGVMSLVGIITDGEPPPVVENSNSFHVQKGYATPVFRSKGGSKARFSCTTIYTRNDVSDMELQTYSALEKQWVKADWDSFAGHSRQYRIVALNDDISVRVGSKYRKDGCGIEEGQAGRVVPVSALFK